MHWLSQPVFSMQFTFIFVPYLVIQSQSFKRVLLDWSLQSCCWINQCLSITDQWLYLFYHCGRITYRPSSKDLQEDQGREEWKWSTHISFLRCFAKTKLTFFVEEIDLICLKWLWKCNSFLMSQPIPICNEI